MAVANGPLTVLLGFALLRALGHGSLGILALVQLGGAASNAVFPLLGTTLIIALDWRDARAQRRVELGVGPSLVLQLALAHPGRPRLRQTLGEPGVVVAHQQPGTG
jgi:hypothetical protein